MEPIPYEEWAKCLYCKDNIKDKCYPVKIEFKAGAKIFAMLEWNVELDKHPPLPMCIACAEDKDRRRNLSNVNAESILRRLMPHASIPDAAIEELSRRLRTGEFSC